MATEDNKQRKRADKKEVLNALDAIHEKYTGLPSTDIEKFAPVYYPIAIVEMNLDEESFENFEAVQHAVLKVISLGILEREVIADTLGLSQKYISKVIRLLNGYGLLDKDGITALGKQSLSVGQKIVKSQVWQKFQIDALNGTLLRVDQAISEDMLNDRDETNITIGHLDYLDGMPVQVISTQLAKNNLNRYIEKKEGIINTNVTKINDVRCTEVKYARCYLMKVRNCDEPIVFAKRYDVSKKKNNERFTWKPFSVKSRSLVDKYGFEDDTPFNTPIAQRYVGLLYDLLKQMETKVNLVEEIPYAMKKVYMFDNSGVEIARTEGVVVPTVNVDERAFRRYRTWILQFMIGIDHDGEYLITNERLYGHIISLRTESMLISDAAFLLVDRIKQYGKSAVFNRIRNKFEDYEGGELIANIYKELQDIKLG